MRLARLLLLVLPVVFLVSCTAEHSKIVVAEYGKYKITMDEFEKEYAKSFGGYEKAKKDSLASYKNFLDLLCNFKMKLRDAEVRGYLKDPDMQKEYIDYKANIGTSLYLENAFYDPNLKALWEKRKLEYRTSHIFLSEDSSHTKEQVLQLGKDLIARLKKGEDFGLLAAQYSKDPNTAKVGGDVYYQVPGRINVPALEDAICSLETGQVYPEPLWSGYGYHVIKVVEKRPRKIAFRIAHIMAKSADSTGKADTVKALRRITDIQTKLKAGEKFEDLAKKYSEDAASASQGGDIGFLEHLNMIREFDEAVSRLKIGEISPIIKTRFGFHLLKVLEEKPYPTFLEDREALKQMFNATRYKNEYATFTSKLLNEAGFVINQETKKVILTNADTLKIGVDYPSSNLKKRCGTETIFTIAATNYPVDSLFAYIKRKADGSAQRLDEKVLDEFVKEYSADLIIREKALNYDKDNQEFAALMEDYKKGIYLFKILDEEVWSKINIDSTATKNYWEKNKENFRWPDRVEFKELHIGDEYSMKNMREELKKGISFDTLYTKYNQRQGFENKPGYYGLVDVNANQIAKEANTLKNIGDLSEWFPFEAGYSMVKLIRKESSRLKTYDEIKAEAASILQDIESKRLEAEYLNCLKNLYQLKVNYDALDKAFKD